jgi:Zn2+/Cd2+-exporting ATPase
VRELILAAEKTKLPIMRIVDQYMGFYTPLVLVIGALVWAFTHDLNRVIAVLVVSCPCAFILATPTAMVAALSAAARLGISSKTSRHRTRRPHQRLRLRQNRHAHHRQARRQPAGPGWAKSNPPNCSAWRLGRKIQQPPHRQGAGATGGEAACRWPNRKDFSEAAGRGIKAQVDAAGRARRPRAMAEGQRRDGGFLKSVDLNETEGFSLIFVARGGHCIGWVGLQDQTRAEAKEALAELKANGVRRVAMISGDRQPWRRGWRGNRLRGGQGRLPAAEQGGVCPRHKAKGYRVAVVGDGVNDAPALAAGDIGIAMGAAGSEVAIHSATIALMNNDLRRLPFLVKLSRSTRTVINQNFLFGVLFIIAGLTLAAGLHEPDSRGHHAQRRVADRDFQQRPAGAQRRGTGTLPAGGPGADSARPSEARTSCAENGVMGANASAFNDP